MNKFLIGIWDLECSDLRANKGVIISSDIKIYGGKHITRVNRNLGKDGLDDKEICQEVKKDLESLGMIVSFYGLNYDRRFLNTRLLRWGLEPLQPRLHTDLCRIGFANISSTRRNLDTIGALLGIEQKKTHFDIQIWLEAAVNGEKKAIDMIVNHNVIDTEVTEKVFERLYPLIKSISQA